MKIFGGNFFKRFKAFSKNEKGELLFYPWRYPGEALVLTSDLRNKAVETYRILFYGSFLSCGYASELEALGVVSAEGVQILFAVIVSIYHLLYFAFVLSYSKKCKLHVVESALRPRKPLILTWFFPLFQFVALGNLIVNWGLSDFISILLFLLLLICTVFTTSVFFLTIKTRGYLLEKGLFALDASGAPLMLFRHR